MMYTVGYFEGALNERFQPLRTFETEAEARHYVWVNYLADAQGHPQNIAIRHGLELILDGRIVGLN